MKLCKCCQIIKSFDNFCKVKRSKDGFYTYCNKCKNKKIKKWRELNPEKTSLHNRNNCKKNYLKNKEKALIESAKWAKENRQKRREIVRNHRLRNLSDFAAKSAKRHSLKLNRMPKWLTKDQIKEIRIFYKLAKELQWLSNEELQVDHIVPLKGKNVSGLHVPWNLQILSKSENIRKSNKI